MRACWSNAAKALRPWPVLSRLGDRHSTGRSPHPHRKDSEERFRMKSLLELLPQIVTEGRREAERVIERAESNYRLGLQTRELVIPSKDSNWQDMLREKDGEASGRLIYGDNLLAMA